jgi:hypothetical protein
MSVCRGSAVLVAVGVWYRYCRRVLGRQEGRSLLWNKSAADQEDTAPAVERVVASCCRKLLPAPAYDAACVLVDS